MKTLKHSLALAAASLLMSSIAWAQPGPGMGGGMGGGMGPGAGPANHPCAAAGQARARPSATGGPTVATPGDGADARGA